MQVQEKSEPEGWKNCTQISKSLMCTINDLKSNTAYIVQVAGRNVVGYSNFTVREAQTLAADEEGEPKGETMSNTLTASLLGFKVVPPPLPPPPLPPRYVGDGEVKYASVTYFGCIDFGWYFLKGFCPTGKDFLRCRGPAILAYQNRTLPV